MAHALTELDDFTTPITVPDGTDSRNDAAEVVEAIAQALANRTKAINEHAAFFDVANVFTEPNTFEDNILAKDGVGVDSESASAAGLVMFTSPDDDPNSGNRWKKTIQALIGGGLCDAMMWAGIPAHDGQLLLTINARWDAATQRWIQQTNTLHSFALMLAHNGTATFTRMDSGSSPWASWPVAGTNTLRANQLAITGEYGFDGGFKVRTTKVRVEDWVVQGGGAYGVAGIRVLGAGDESFAPLHVPVGARLHEASILVNAAGTSLKSFSATSRTGGSFTTPTLPTPGVVDNDTSTASGAVRLDVDFGGVVVAQGDQYGLFFKAGDNTDTIYDARITWDDPGPRGGST